MHYVDISLLFIIQYKFFEMEMEYCKRLYVMLISKIFYFQL